MSLEISGEKPIKESYSSSKVTWRKHFSGLRLLLRKDA
jgi:hypothetical protein